MYNKPVTIMSFTVTRSFAGVFALLALIIGITFGVMNLTETGEPDIPDVNVSPQDGHDVAEQENAEPSSDCHDTPAINLVSYTVEPGDTLTGISQRFGTTVSSIVAINGLTSPDKIPVGQNLMIMQNASGIVRRIASGDTLSDICKAYAVSMDTVIEVNDITDPHHLTPGQLLLLPGASTTNGTVLAASGSRSVSLLWPVTGSVTSGLGTGPIPLAVYSSFMKDRYCGFLRYPGPCCCGR